MIYAAALGGYPNPWRYQPHPEVWLLVVSIIAIYVYTVRTIGPTAVGPDRPAVTRRNVFCFVLGVALLWLASDWPIHDIGEQYLYSVHMFQHMVLSYFMPPLLLLAMPEWFMRLLIGRARTYRWFAFMSKPVIAGIVFNALVMITHIPGVVNTSVQSAPLHYGLHTLLVLSSLLMWMPVCGPLPELRIAPAPAMIYLFLQSVVPTIPAGWLTFADGVVYKHYDVPVRVWGMSVMQDQQLAGAVMKSGGGVFLWTLVVIMFFKRFAGGFRSANDGSYRRGGTMPDAEIVGAELLPLTYADVERAFEASAAPAADR